MPTRYRVVGPRPIHGAKPGSFIEREMTMEQIVALLKGGHIEPVNKLRPSKKNGSTKESTPKHEDTENEEQ